MDLLENFLRCNNLQNPEDMDSLLEMASLVRQSISENRISDINSLICYTVEHSYYEAFSWIIGILQEAFDKDYGTLSDFECPLGKFIPDYDAFTQNLHVNFSSLKNGIETVYDENGEVISFFNIIVYKTGFKNISLISSENFDTKDNDFVLYKLSFANN